MKSSITTTLAGLALASSLQAQGFKTSEFPYLAETPSADFSYEPIMTSGDRVPLSGTSGYAGTEFAFAGVPDAMGVYKDSVSGQNILFIAHELGNGAQTTPVPGFAPFRGAFVSRFVLANGGGVISAGPAHKELFLENTFQASLPPTGASGANFTRFCSGAFAGPAQGLDRPIFFTNEETFGSANYSTPGDNKGAQSVAIIDGKMHTLPDLGRIGRENTLVQPRRDGQTVIISTEDAGSPSYVYMYVGQKQRRSASALDKNGLTNGKVFVLCGRDAQHNEGTYTSGSLPVKWAEIVGGGNLSDAGLLAAADAAGAFGFVRVEDCEFDPTQPTRSLYLATTGGSGPNRLGRLYDLQMNPTNPTANGTLNMVYNADQIVTPGGTYNGVLGTLTGGSPTGSLGSYSGGDINAGVDFPVSIDNIAVSGDWIMCQEDRNSPADAVFTKYARNGGIWSLDRSNANAAKLQSTFNYAQVQARDGMSFNFLAGQWESSGIIDSGAIFGPGTFVVNVQAHRQTFDPDGVGPLPAVSSGRTTAPDGSGGFLTGTQFNSTYGEDGQFLIMRPKP